MKFNFDAGRYGERSQAATVVSMIKRREGPATRGRSFHARCRDLRLMTLAHNIMILWQSQSFSTEPVMTLFPLRSRTGSETGAPSRSVACSIPNGIGITQLRRRELALALTWTCVPRTLLHHGTRHRRKQPGFANRHPRRRVLNLAPVVARAGEGLAVTSRAFIMP